MYEYLKKIKQKIWEGKKLTGQENLYLTRKYPHLIIGDIIDRIKSAFTTSPQPTAEDYEKAMRKRDWLASQKKSDVISIDERRRDQVERFVKRFTVQLASWRARVKSPATFNLKEKDVKGLKSKIDTFTERIAGWKKELKEYSKKYPPKKRTPEEQARIDRFLNIKVSL